MRDALKRIAESRFKACNLDDKSKVTTLSRIEKMTIDSAEAMLDQMMAVMSSKTTLRYALIDYFLYTIFFSFFVTD